MKNKLNFIPITSFVFISSDWTSNLFKWIISLSLTLVFINSLIPNFLEWNNTFSHIFVPWEPCTKGIHFFLFSRPFRGFYFTHSLCCYVTIDVCYYCSCYRAFSYCIFFSVICRSCPEVMSFMVIALMDLEIGMKGIDLTIALFWLILMQN